jgi:hypothetical protein
MTPAELERWKSRQIAALVACGINPIDAHNQVTRFLAKVPPGADPNTYVPRDVPGGEELTGKTAMSDLRAAWYGDEDVPARFKRLLDAKGKP